jgi:hypothetical protein
MWDASLENGKTTPSASANWIRASVCIAGAVCTRELSVLAPACAKLWYSAAALSVAAFNIEVHSDAYS